MSLGLDCMSPGDEENFAGIEHLHEELPDPAAFAEAYDWERENDYFRGKYVKFPIVNLMRAYGKDWKQAWMKLTRNRMFDWYMNTIGNWSDGELIRTARLPYVWPLEGFPTTKTCIFRDFPDVYSDDPYALVQQAGELTGKPVIVGEFHFGALDAGMLSAGIRSVMTQKDRGLAYRAYYERGMDSPYFVGSHYFTLNDQATLGRFDGENMQIGFIDVCQRPYTTFIDSVRETNRSIYEIADGKRENVENQIHRIPQIMGF